MTVNQLLADIFRYKDMAEINESLDPLYEGKSDDIRNWYATDPSRLSMKPGAAFKQFIADNPQYASDDPRINTNNYSMFTKTKKTIDKQVNMGNSNPAPTSSDDSNGSVTPTTNTNPIDATTIKRPVSKSTAIIEWIKQHPTERFAVYATEYPDDDTPSCRTIFNKARVALGLSNKSASKQISKPADPVEDEGLPVEEEEDTVIQSSATAKQKGPIIPDDPVSDYQGSTPIANRTNVIHPTDKPYPDFSDKSRTGRPTTIYPGDIISSGDVAGIRYYLTSKYNLSRDEINGFITNLIYDKKWSHQLNPETQFEIIKDAINGEKRAINLLFLANFQNIAYNYTAGPTPYLGVSFNTADMDDKATYIGLCYNTLAGNFNPNSDKSGCSLHPKKGPLSCKDILGKNEYPFINFGTRYSNLLQSGIREQLKIEKAGGITGKAAVSNKTAGTFQHVAATWKNEHNSTKWDEFVLDNPYAEWKEFYPGPLTDEHSLNNEKFTNQASIIRRKQAFQKAYIEDLKHVSYDLAAANMNMDSDTYSGPEAFETSDKDEARSSEFLKDIRDLIQDEDYTDDVNTLMLYTLDELQAEEDYRAANTSSVDDDKDTLNGYQVKALPLDSNRAKKAKMALGELFNIYDITMSDFIDGVRKLSPQMLINYIQNHR